MQSLCTLRGHCCQWSRNTRYQTGAAPYLGRSSTGWIAPACLAHSFDHLVGAAQQREWDGEAECLGSPEVYDQLDSGRPLDREITRLLSFENFSGVDADQTIRFRCI